MKTEHLTLKELTEAVGANITPRMVRHYHTLGLLPEAQRSEGNYRLYTQQDVQQLRRIVALKQHGFQLSHIHQLLESDADAAINPTLIAQLQQQYRVVLQQLDSPAPDGIRLRGITGARS